MAFIRSKIINGRTYYYLQESYRKDGKVKTRSKYIGKNPNEINAKKEKLRSFDTLPQNENLDGNEKIDTTIEKNQIHGAKTDKRDKFSIAQDMTKNSKIITSNKKLWEKNKGKIDLNGWDTTHIKKHLDTHHKSFKPIHRKLKTIFKGAEVSGRVKQLPSLAEKIRKKNKTDKFVHTDSTDLIGVRALFNNEKKLRKSISGLKKSFKIVEERDYIKKPKGDYRAYHLIIEDKKGKKAEIQLKTHNQQKWSDYAHDTVYKDINKTKKILGKKGFNDMNKYLKEMSEYHLKIDNGQKAIKPKIPQSIKKIYGEL